MSIFSACVKIRSPRFPWRGIDILRLPVTVMKDAVTLGGISTNQEKPYTAQVLEDIKEGAIVVPPKMI